MTIGISSKGIWLFAGGVAAIVLAVILFFAVPAYLRVNRFEGYKEGLEQQFLFDANRLRHQLTGNLLDRLYCRISSAKHGGQKVTLSPEQAVQARHVLMSVLSCTRMQPSFLRVSKHHVAHIGYIAFFSTAQDAERDQNSVVSIGYYEYPNAVRISAAKHFNVCDIDILLDQETHAEVRELIEGTTALTTTPTHNIDAEEKQPPLPSSNGGGEVESRGGAVG